MSINNISSVYVISCSNNLIIRNKRHPSSHGCRHLRHDVLFVLTLDVFVSFSVSYTHTKVRFLKLHSECKVLDEINEGGKFYLMTRLSFTHVYCICFVLR